MAATAAICALATLAFAGQVTGVFTFSGTNGDGSGGAPPNGLLSMMYEPYTDPGEDYIWDPGIGVYAHDPLNGTWLMIDGDQYTVWSAGGPPYFIPVPVESGTISMQ